MKKVIVYNHEYHDEDGEPFYKLHVIHPTDEALAERGIEAIARKDVQWNRPYKIIDESELPSRETRSEWDFHDADLLDGIGSESYFFDE